MKPLCLYKAAFLYILEVALDKSDFFYSSQFGLKYSTASFKPTQVHDHMKSHR